MPSPKIKTAEPELTQEWTLPGAATLGSTVRAKGILLEVRARLPFVPKKALDIRGQVLILRMPESAGEPFRAAVTAISNTLVGIEDLPVIPREIQDILAISTTERHRWLKDGRLQSAGTRTVKLHGRARKITFHVFDPRRVEEILNDDLVATWREDDAETAAENRRRAAWNRKLTREQKRTGADALENGLEEGPRPQLAGWEEFEREMMLR